MSTLVVEMERAEARKDTTSNEFTGAVRPIEATGLEKGDVLIIPNDFAGKVMTTKIGDNKAEYIFCQLEGTDQVKQLFPSTFTKSRVIYDEDGMPTRQRVFTTGSAAELFRSAGSVQKGMEALKGKKIVVSDMMNIRTLRYGTTSLMTAMIPVIDLVDETAE